MTDYQEETDHLDGLYCSIMHVTDLIDVLHRDIKEGRKDSAAVFKQLTYIHKFSTELSKNMKSDASLFRR